MAEWFRKPEPQLPPVLDEGYLERLAAHIGFTEVRELLADGLLELSDRLDQLHRHAERDEIREITRICHEIAGSAGHLGLSRLSRAAVEACRMSNADVPPPAAEIVAGVDAVRAATIEAASRYCRIEVPDRAVPDD